MRRALLTMVALLLAMPCRAGHPVVQTLRQDLKVQERLLAGELEALTRHQVRMAEAWERVSRLSDDLLRAEAQGETLDSLRLRDEDLQQVEGELAMYVLEAARLRGAVIASRTVIAELEEELARLDESLGPAEDPLSGTWQAFIEPGGQEGLMYLSLDGTLVQGTYRLEGGWSGSVRGTLVAQKVRLERVDSQLGYSVIYYGRLFVDGDMARIEGRWEATQLATGLPAAGTWVAERLDDLAED
jgi:hypothetical protein